LNNVNESQFLNPLENEKRRELEHITSIADFAKEGNNPNCLVVVPKMPGENGTPELYNKGTFFPLARLNFITHEGFVAWYNFAPSEDIGMYLANPRFTELEIVISCAPNDIRSKGAWLIATDEGKKRRLIHISDLWLQAQFKDIYFCAYTYESSETGRQSTFTHTNNPRLINTLNTIVGVEIKRI